MANLGEKCLERMGILHAPVTDAGTYGIDAAPERKKERICPSRTEGPSEMQHCQLRSCEHRAESELSSTTTFSRPSLQTTYCLTIHLNSLHWGGGTPAAGLAAGADNQIYWVVWVRWPGTTWSHLHRALMDTGAQCTLLPWCRRED